MTTLINDVEVAHAEAIAEYAKAEAMVGKIREEFLNSSLSDIRAIALTDPGDMFDHDPHGCDDCPPNCGHIPSDAEFAFLEKRQALAMEIMEAAGFRSW